MAQTHRISRNNTKVKTVDGIIVVTLHGTDVVKFPEDKSWVVFNSGGWLTSTTKTRMNQTCSQYDINAGVYQVKGEWFVWVSGVKYPFVDGVRYATEE